MWLEQSETGHSRRRKEQHDEDIIILEPTFCPREGQGTSSRRSSSSGDRRDNRAQHLHPGHLGEDRAQHLQPGLWEGDRAQQWHQDQGVPSGAGRHQDLPELQAGDLSPLVLGDWLEMIAPVMKDLSPQAHRWWELVELEGQGYYEQWRVATPMARLHIKPKCQVVEKNPTLQRTEQRGISLLVRAIPSSMRETIVSAVPGSGIFGHRCISNYNFSVGLQRMFVG